MQKLRNYVKPLILAGSIALAACDNSGQEPKRPKQQINNPDKIELTITNSAREQVANVLSTKQEIIKNQETPDMLKRNIIDKFNNFVSSHYLISDRYEIDDSDWSNSWIYSLRNLQKEIDSFNENYPNNKIDKNIKDLKMPIQKKVIQFFDNEIEKIDRLSFMTHEKHSMYSWSNLLTQINLTEEKLNSGIDFTHINKRICDNGICKVPFKLDINYEKYRNQIEKKSKKLLISHMEILKNAIEPGKTLKTLQFEQDNPLYFDGTYYTIQFAYRKLKIDQETKQAIENKESSFYKFMKTSNDSTDERIMARIEKNGYKASDIDGQWGDATYLTTKYYQFSRIGNSQADGQIGKNTIIKLQNELLSVL